MPEDQNPTRRSFLGFAKETRDSSTRKLSPKRIGRSIKGNITIIVFFVLSAALGWLSWVILPNTAPPAVAGGMYIVIPKQTVIVTSMSIFAQNTGRAEGDQDVEIDVTVKPVKLATVLRFTLGLPAFTFGTGGCKFDTNGYGAALYQKYNSCDELSPVNIDNINIRVQTEQIASSNTYGADVELHITGRPSSYSEGDSAVTAILPRVTGLAEGAHVEAEYTFTGDVETFLWQGRVPDNSSFGQATWELSRQELAGPPISTTAVKPTGQANDNKRLFIAGALIGVAGAALLAAIQESLSKIRRKGQSHLAQSSEDLTT